MTLNLLFVGDVMLGRFVNELLQGVSPAHPWRDTRKVFLRADWRACNLECAISDRGNPWDATPKAFHFRSDARNAAVLGSAHIDVVSLANNHSLDFGYEAMFDTLRILDSAGIAHAGAGANFHAASAMTVSSVGGMRIGFIAFTDNQPEWEATADRPGVLYTPIDADDERARRLLRLIKRARKSVDLLVVSAHWGPNWGYVPPVEHPRFARQLIDHGAAIVFGHSGHVFRGIEIYKQRPILHCTGDFIDDYAVDELERNDQSFMFLIHAQANSIRRIRLYPTLIDTCQARRARGRQADTIAAKMKELCDGFGTRSVWDRRERVLEIRL